MPNNENSYPDRLNRGRQMYAALAAFEAPFAPTDPNLQPNAFNSYLNGVESANAEVASAEVDFSSAAASRKTAAEEVQAKALRVKDHVSANVGWKKYLPAVEGAAKLVRGTHLPKKKPAAPAEGGTPPAPKPARQGAASQKGYADVANNFGKLIAAVRKVTGYTAAAGSGLLVVNLEGQLGAFVSLNAAVTSAEAELAEKQRVRSDFYDGENGLRDKMKAIKLAVRSQYGSGSPEYAAVRGIGV